MLKLYVVVHLIRNICYIQIIRRIGDFRKYISLDCKVRILVYLSYKHQPLQCFSVEGSYTGCFEKAFCFLCIFDQYPFFLFYSLVSHTNSLYAIMVVAAKLGYVLHNLCLLA